MLICICTCNKLAQEIGCNLIMPTWFNLSIGPYLRHQSDKRHNLGLFFGEGKIRGLNKLFKLLDSVGKCDFTNCVAGHIRLGDYPEPVRIPIHWYKKKNNSL